MQSVSPSGLSWSEYFAEYRRKLERAKEPDQVITQDAPILLTPSSEVSGSSAPGAPGKLLKRLLALGYTARVNRALVRMPATLRVNATEEHAAGSLKTPAYNLEAFYLVAHWKGAQPEQRVAMDATWERKHVDTPPPQAHKSGSMTFKIATTYDPYLGYEVRTTASKPRKQNEVEAELGIDPPAGFNEWFNMICPQK